MDNNVRKSSDARIRANRKYMEKIYRNLQVQVKPDDWNIAEFIVKNL